MTEEERQMILKYAHYDEAKEQTPYKIAIEKRMKIVTQLTTQN